ncbi:MAG: nuclear transport factor 2 family protein [Gemmatimonadaceae bacterium]|nr:nuclear transport factor 2 family protein [Gemmatimonadaceae bacterium]
MTGTPVAPLPAADPNAAMADAVCGRNRRLLDDFARAWQGRDIDAVMDCLSDDVIYDASVGPGPGRRFQGRDDVRQGIITMFAFDDAAVMQVETLCVHDDFAVVLWRYASSADAAAAPSVRGVDVMRFRNDRIVLKDAFRKVQR